MAKKKRFSRDQLAYRRKYGLQLPPGVVSYLPASKKKRLLGAVDRVVRRTDLVMSVNTIHVGYVHGVHVPHPLSHHQGPLRHLPLYHLHCTDLESDDDLRKELWEFIDKPYSKYATSESARATSAWWGLRELERARECSGDWAERAADDMLLDCWFELSRYVRSKIREEEEGFTVMSSLGHPGVKLMLEGWVKGGRKDPEPEGEVRMRYPQRGFSALGRMEGTLLATLSLDLRAELNMFLSFANMHREYRDYHFRCLLAQSSRGIFNREPLPFHNWWADKRTAGSDSLEYKYNKDTVLTRRCRCHASGPDVFTCGSRYCKKAREDLMPTERDVEWNCTQRGVHLWLYGELGKAV